MPTYPRFKPAVNLDLLPRSARALSGAGAGAATAAEQEHFGRLHRQSSQRFAAARGNLRTAMQEYACTPTDQSWRNLEARWRLVDAAATAVAADLANLERMNVRAAVVELVNAVDMAWPAPAL